MGIELPDRTSSDPQCLVYFPASVNPGFLESVEAQLAALGAALLGSTEVEARDWQADYRKRAAPFAVGEKWWVDPREPGSGRAAAPEGRSLLQIPARTAFGTGSHSSTALLVELMDRFGFDGCRVLDVGTGTGILAMIALISGAEDVIGLDTDPAAVFVAAETCRLNGLEPRLLVGGLPALGLRSPRDAFDVILANVLPANLASDLADLVSCLQPSGTLLLSGLQADQRAQIVARLADLGMSYKGQRRRDGWAALELERMNV